MPGPNRHGGPADRGSADAWYRRGRNPHKFQAGSYTSLKVEGSQLTPEEVAAYNKAFDEGMATGEHKDWN